MKLTSDIEDAIDAIRDNIYEEIKDMTSGERTAYFNAIFAEAKQKYNFRFAESAVSSVVETSVADIHSA